MKEFAKAVCSLIIGGLLFSANWQGITSNTPAEAGAALLSSNESVTTLEFQVEGYYLTQVHTEDGPAIIVEIDEGTPILEAGSPDLEKLTTSIIIPGTAQMEITILESEYQEFPLLNIAPSKGPITRDIDPDSIPYEYGTPYQTDEFYPGVLAELNNPYILRDFRGQTVVVNPFQYNPISQILRVYTTIVLEVRENGISDINTIGNDEPEVMVKEFKEIYSRHFINFTNSRYSVLEEEGSMLVIANDSFLDVMEPFVEWKTMRGIPTELLSLSDVGGNASSIKSYVTDRYNNNNLSFLLLIGDIAQMPSLSTNGAASDPSFGYIAGSDYYPEIMVGRFSAENTAHVETQVTRSINYERFPFEDVQWFNRGTGIASDQGEGIGDEGEGDWQHLDNIREKLMNFTYVEVDQIYDTDGANASQVTNALNEGRSIINYTGHGWDQGWGTTGFSNSHVNNLSNTDMLPFIVSVACVNGAFDVGTCFAEAWLRATNNGTPAGAVAMAASTVNQQWATPMEGQDEFNDILVELYEDNIKRTYGGIFYNATMKMIDSYNYNGEMEASNWHIFGDPSLHVRTDIPTHPTVNYDSAILIGQSEFVVEVNSEGALAVLSENGQLISNAYVTGGAAVLELEDAASTPGDWDLVITGFNVYPYEGTVSIMTPEGPHLVFTGYEVESAGGDLQIDFNEEVELTITAANVGVEDASTVTAMVSTNDPDIEILSESLAFSDVPASTDIASSNPLVFQVAENVEDEQLVTFQIEFISDEGSWNSSFQVELHAPVFEIGLYSILDENNDGIWDPGESVELIVNLSNNGSAGFWNYPGAVLSTSSDYVTITGNENNIWYGIGPGQTYEGIFQVIASTSTPTDTEIDFTLVWGYSNISACENDCLDIAELYFTYTVGPPTTLIWDPSSNHTSGDRLVSYFTEIGFAGFDYFTTSSIPELTFYKTAFISLGIFPNNHILSENQVSGFVNILENGGNIYLEGSDTWAFDSQTSFHGMFGLNGVSDGSADLGTIIGVEGAFSENLALGYNGENSYIDRLSPAGGFPILENLNPNYVTAIAYENEISNYRTVGASHELGGLQGDDFDDYMAGLLNFLNTGGTSEFECTPGDVNNDGVQNILDIVSQVNIVIGAGDPPDEYELCAADMNLDGIINVLDIIININIIIGGRSSSRSDNIADFSQITLQPNSAFIQADGAVSGIQMTVKTNNLTVNETLGMDTALNQKDGEYILLVFSLSGLSLSGEKVNLFETEGDFEVTSVIIVNTLGDEIDVSIFEEFLPEAFALEQNFPNPFNPQTQIQFTIGQEKFVNLSVFDIRGRLVATLTDGLFPSGHHTMTWNGRNQAGSELTSGVYLCILKSEDLSISRKMLMIK